MFTKGVSGISVFVICVTTAALALLVDNAHSTRRPTVQPFPTPVGENVIKRSFPVVEFATQRSSDPYRVQKGRKYDKFWVLDPEITSDEKIISSVDWLAGLDELPIADSQLIMTGRVLEGRAFLSANSTSVYSEFNIELQEVYKNSLKTSLENEKFLIAERPGGVVRFRSGYTLWYFIAGQRMPVVGETYLFFLSNRFPMYGVQVDDLFILTAYRLHGGKVYPLDFADGGRHPTAYVFAEKDEAVLFDKLRKTLSAAKQMSQL